MGAFKQLNSEDIIVSPLEVSKAYRSTIAPVFSSSGGYSYISYGVGRYSESLDRVDAYGFENQIERFLGKNVEYNKNSQGTGIYTSFKPSSIYNSVKQLYYSNFLEGKQLSTGEYVQGDANQVFFNKDGTTTGSDYNTIYDNYNQTDLLQQRFLPTASNSEIAIISIPTDLYGDKVKPGSFRLKYGAYSASSAGVLEDDGEGRLYLNNALVGNIIYTHGMVAITSPSIGSEFGYSLQDYSVGVFGSITSSADFYEGFISGSDITASFSSSYTLYETQYKVTLGESEFNYSQNPTSISGSDGIPYNFITGSYFTPYVTTVGLYNDAYELLAVGKLAKPLPTSNFSDTSILINLDRQ